MPPKTPNNSSNQVLEKKTPMLPAAGTGIYIPTTLTNANATTTATTMKTPSIQAYPTPATSSSSSSLFKESEQKIKVKNLEKDNDILDGKGVKVVSSIPISPLTPEELEQIFAAAADKNDFAKLKQLLDKVQCDINTIVHPARRHRLRETIERTGNMDAIRYIYEIKKVNDTKICIYSLYQNKKFTQETKQYLKSTSVFNYTNFHPKPTELHLAVIADDIVKVKEILEKNVIPIDAKDGSGDTALYYAVISNNLAMIELLLDAKANVNIESSTMTKAIHDAAMYGSCKAVQLLIVKGKADFNTPVVSGVWQGYTPLTLAIEQGHLEIVTELIANQVDFQAPLTSGTFQEYTPLLIAIKYGYLEIVQELIAKSVDFKTALVSNKMQGLTPLAIAISWGQLKIVKELIAKGADFKDPLTSGALQGYTPLAIAIQYGHVKIVAELIANGADCKTAFISPRMNGLTPLAFAIRRGHLEIVKELVSNQIDCKSPLVSGSFKTYTPLAMAFQLGHLEIAKELVAKGADFNAAFTVGSYLGSTPLAIAIQLGHLGLVKELIAKQVDFKAPLTSGSFKGYSPLAIAIRHGHVQIVKELIANGADCKAAFISPRMNGFTPLTFAIRRGHLQIVKELVSNQVDCKSPLVSGSFKAYTPLAMAFEFGHLEIAKELVAKGADFNAAFTVGSYLGSTPLAIAIQLGHLALVKELIAKGADFKAAFISGPYLGFTPLAVAIEFGQSDIVKELITKGVDCKAKLTSTPFPGLTYLTSAILYGREDIVKELIANDVDFKTPTIPSKNFSIVTPLFFAAYAGKKNIFDCLVKQGAEIKSILKSENDRTALFALVSETIKNQTFDRNKEMIQYLVKLGIDRDAVCASVAPDEGKKTVFDIAKDHPEILDCLQTDIERHIKIGILKFEKLIEAVATGTQQLPNDRTLHVADDEKITTGDHVGSFLTSVLNRLVSYYDDASDVKPYSKYYLNKLQTLKCSAARPFITETSSDHVLTFASTVLSNKEMNDLEAVLQNFLNINRAIFSANLMSSVRDPVKKIKIILHSSIPSSTASSSFQSVSVPSSSSTSNAPPKNEEPPTKKRKATETADVGISSNLTDLFKKTDALIKIPATAAGASPSFFVAQGATASASSSSSQDVNAHTHHKRKREDEAGAGFGNGNQVSFTTPAKSTGT